MDYNAEVSHREEVAEGLWILRVRPLDAEIPEFRAGQYAELGLNLDSKLVRRQYSIASQPSERSFLEFVIVLVEDGQLTPQLYKLGPGERLWLGPKIKGKFTLDEIPSDRDLVMVATGTGNAPYVSMLREYQSKGRWRRFVLVHGVRHASDLTYSDEMFRLAETDPSVFYVPLATREPESSAWSGLRGRVGVALEPETYAKLVGSALAPENCHIFLCGNPEMIDSMQEMLESRGFKKHSRRNPGNLHFERYW